MFKPAILLGLLACLTACARTPLPARASTTEPVTEDWLAVYFSDPNAPGAELTQGGPDEPLQAALDAARQSIDMAIYDLNMNNIRKSLAAAAQRGVRVRLVIESENFTAEELAPLQAAGIRVVSDNNPNLMHHKFTIIDQQTVWTGSFNYTISDAYGNRNNLVRVNSRSLAENYYVEFEEMFIRGLFGGSSPANTPNPSFSVNGSVVETYFSPEDGVLPNLVELVNNAQESIYFLAYTFTSDDLAEAIIAANERGVQVRGVMDEAQATNPGSEFGRLIAKHIDVRLDGEGGRLHHKVLIVDAAIVSTGSYNFSANAETRNDENSLVIHDIDLASEFMEEFWRIWDLAKP